MAYHFAWWTLASGDPAATFGNIFSAYGLKYATYVTVQAAAVYFSLYFLLPRLLERGRYLSYLLAVVGTVITASWLIVAGYYGTAFVSGRSFEDLFYQPPTAYYHLFKSNALPSTAAAMTLGLSIKLAKSWLAAHQRQQELEKEKLTTELRFLRSQFHPHFLFNTINSIFFLIHKNPDMAAASLAKFSELLRYQLYEVNATFIHLQRELDYLAGFVELERLRQDQGREVEVTLPASVPPRAQIAPFLLLPFVENAFKHLSSWPNRPNKIGIRVCLLDEQELVLQIHNTRNSAPPASDLLPGGIGLPNVRRRLELLYPQRHKLTVTEGAEDYRVDLQLTLYPTPLSPSV
ncbi:MAG: histidine kinase [Bacteroidota bacterium]